MNRIVFHGTEKRPSVLKYAEDADFGFLSEWKASVRGDKHPRSIDSVTFADLAIRRFKSHRLYDPYVCCSSEISTYVRDNPNAEIGNFVLLKTEWFDESSVLGLCHFRRTWSNNVILDYLAVHPYVAKQNAEWPVRGVGTVLVGFAAKVAIDIGAKYMWGEATQNSCDYYKKIFALPDTSDLIYAPIEKLTNFTKKVEKAQGA